LHDSCFKNSSCPKSIYFYNWLEFLSMRYLRAFFIFLLSLTFFNSNASHIRAGEVIAKRISGLTYQFTFTGYRDTGGLVNFDKGIFDFGDGEVYGGDKEIIPWIDEVDIGNNTERWQFTLVHEYAAGDNYLVSYTEAYRNHGIQNINGSGSTDFHVETLVVIDALITNSTPYFTVPPIDVGVVGVVFEHNPGAFDPDGDSLSYYFTTPKQALNVDVGGYRSLIDPAFYDNFNTGNSTGTNRPTLSIDAVNGTLEWDAPGEVGTDEDEQSEYNVALVVEEWRKIGNETIRLGFVTRDMQIIIWNFDNDPPELEIPEDTCVIAGTTIQAIITASDPDGDQVELEAFGGPFEVSNSKATYSPKPPLFQDLPAILNFEWETICGHIRSNAYEVQFKATDKPTIEGITNPPGQVNFETWTIKVVGPAPTGLIAAVQSGRQMQLNWDAYSCPNADSIQVWRRVDEFDIDPTCNPGIPKNSGYELIKTLSANNTSYLDTNNDFGLSPGSKYCYRLVATFPGVLSIASEEACDGLLIDVPVITNVNVISTGETDGEIQVRWTPPYEIDAIEFPPTYTYEVMRKEGTGEGGTYTSVFGQSTDTTFLDTGLNTRDLVYTYQVALYYNDGDFIDTSERASSVRLEPQPLIGAIRINWEADVPWSMNVQDHPYHYVFRDNVINGNLSSVQLIDSVEVTQEGFTYLDDGRFNGVDLDEEIEYCYYVETKGSYGNALLPSPLLNKSQIICAQPNDTIPPCAPVSITFSAAFNCESQVTCLDASDLRNSFSWQFDGDQSCDNDIVLFKIYSDRDSKGLRSNEFREIGTTTRLEYIDAGLESFAYCYYITAVDRSGNESQASEIFCNDNCVQYKLPNVFTPNGDITNETFGTFQGAGDCPRFVESVKFKVFNRSGVEIFTYNSGVEKPISINWNGKTNGGKELPAGVYFYSAEVKFIRLNPEESVEVINGWVQIIR
jgi:gliding motility-associated-like protein